ncbi:hypothetical protein K488DRAFT_46416 [Vararia minispora EC-137]|uniref:Uncharacterized protein n=1 Tax=Vararia minispora EC-137 TaxID=1314806 RepID=A0ACB8QRH5_9AGAM|nr:hypothetical protein K488DRAFT_46416 [Vararia minispora EC-137]
MSISRAESQYSRRRSNTAQSIFRAPSVPLKIGDSKTFTAWVHDPKDSPTVLVNHAVWPGIAEGDLVRLSHGSADGDGALLFVVPKEEAGNKPQLQACEQISLPRSSADAFDIRNNTEIHATKVDKLQHEAEYVEIIFQDQYLGRNDMWRLGEQLTGQCLHVGQEVSFIGAAVAKVDTIYIRGQKTSSAYVTSRTKTIFRTLSAMITIFIQVCRELWEFSGDGERYNEKIVHSFLPELFARWKHAGTNHTVTIVLISRVFYDRSEVEFAAGPLRQLESGPWYKDFYKVITDLEVISDWRPTLVSLKDSIWAFQRDILLTHHYHRSFQTPDPSSGPEEVRLVGNISFAHDGPVLEALNMALNPMEKHYIDRSLSLTGNSIILITPGTGYYRVPKQLVRLTTTRMLDQGITLDLISLAKPPLHRTPMFSFQGVDPEVFGAEKSNRYGSRAMDPLWGGDDNPGDCVGHQKTTFWWEPFWIGISFWDKQMDMPMRKDRFVARAKMHEIQMLGLLDHDVLSSIEVPFLPEHYGSLLSPVPESRDVAKAEADKFDNEIFSFPSEARETKSIALNRTTSVPSVVGSSLVQPLRSHDKRASLPSNRLSTSIVKIPPIEESPRVVNKDLPSKTSTERQPSPKTTALAVASLQGLSTSPSGSSIRSARSAASSSKRGTEARRTIAPAATLLSSKLAPSWLFNPFRSAISQPETSNVSASGESTPPPSSPLRIAQRDPSSVSPASHQAAPSDRSRSPQPMPIKKQPPPRQRVYEESVLTHRGSLQKATVSPISSSPRDDLTERRRSAPTSSYAGPNSISSSPSMRPNPSSPQVTISYNQASLARRWQHMFSEPIFKLQVNWRSMITPCCLPLTTEHFPSMSELETSYDVFSYDFVVDPPETSSFLVRPPSVIPTNPDEVRSTWALVVMRGMIALRLAQGFQFVLRASEPKADTEPHVLRRGTSFVADDDMMPKPEGAAEALQAPRPVYLSMSNEIHRISFTGETIQVRRYVRRLPPTPPFEYKCLIWPKLGVGYTELSTPFVSHGLENYGWNRFTYSPYSWRRFTQQFNESLRYWRTRFVVIPTSEPPNHHVIANDGLNDEEIRIVGIEKLGELFSRVRWQPPEERAYGPPAPVRLLPTYFSPSAMLADEHLMSQLDDIHATGPLRKKVKSERDFSDLSSNLSAVARAMRVDGGVPIKEHRWHKHKYPESFVGHDFVSWLVREFRDVSTREQGTEWGVRLLELGLFEHCTGRHGFLDGYYFYQLKGEYAIVSTPRVVWFLNRQSQQAPIEEYQARGAASSSVPRSALRKTKRRVILSQTMVIDIDPSKKSDQTESAILHHDIIHNPSTVFHFELQWIGTTARCIEDLLRTWTRTIERYGLTLVEAYVTQISDVASMNPFQSCFPVQLALPPPIVPHLAQRVPEGTSPKFFFEFAVMRRFGFVPDVEPPDLYPASKDVDAIYSYRRAPYTYPQFVHRSGVAFAQVLGGAQGFLFLTNRLMGTGRVREGISGPGSKGLRPATIADELRRELLAFCSDRAALAKVYSEEIELLSPLPNFVAQEPPELAI